MMVPTAKPDDEEDYEVADLSTVPGPKIEFVMPNLTPLDSRSRKPKISKKTKPISTSSVLTNNQNSEIGRMRSVIREARFFFIQRLIRRLKRSEILLAKKPKDTLRRKVKRLEEELHAVKTIRVDEICKFVLLNKNTLNELKVSCETSTNDRCLHKLSRDPRVIKAVMECSIGRGDFGIFNGSGRELEQRTERRAKQVKSSLSTIEKSKEKRCLQKFGAFSPSNSGKSDAVIKQIRLDKGESIEFEKKPGTVVHLTSEKMAEDTDSGNSTFFLPYSASSSIYGQSITHMQNHSQTSEYSKKLNKGQTIKEKREEFVGSLRSKHESSGSAKKSRTNVGELHPSWTARKQARERQRLAPKGKRIVFSDD